MANDNVLFITVVMQLKIAQVLILKGLCESAVQYDFTILPLILC